MLIAPSYVSLSMKTALRCLNVVTKKEMNTTDPTISRIFIFLSSVSSQFLLINKQAVPAITTSEITPIRINDIDMPIIIILHKNKKKVWILILDNPNQAISHYILSYFVISFNKASFIILMVCENINFLATFTYLSLMILLQSMKIPCEFVTTSWPTNIKVQLNSREMIVSTRYNFDMIVDVKDQTVSRSIDQNGLWQANQIHVIAHFLKPGYKVLNLGSQTGLQAIMIGKLIGPKGRLFIAQPYSVSYNIVRKNIYLNDLEDITVLYKVGASDVQSEQKMVIFNENTGAAQLYDFANYPSDLTNRQYETEIVRVDAMDNVIPKDVSLDFMLIDVEKMEVQALLGMMEIIQRSKNLVILMQWEYKDNPLHNENKTLRCLKQLKKLHFNFYLYDPKDGNQCQVGNFIKVDQQRLLEIETADIIIAPEHIDPTTL